MVGGAALRQMMIDRGDCKGVIVLYIVRTQLRTQLRAQLRRVDRVY